MADYNPNSIWTSRQKQYGSSTESPAVEEGISGVSPSGDGGGGKGNSMLWFFAVLAVLTAVGVVYFVFLRTPNVDVGVAFAKPDQVFIGEPFVISVSLSNNSETIIKNGALELILPDGFSFADQPSDQQAVSTSTNDISPGSAVTENFTLVATGNPNSIGHIAAKFLYGTAATGKTQFERDGSTDVITGLPAVGLTFTIPQDVFSGQQFNIAVNYHNNTSHDIRNVALTMRYPAEFVFTTSSMPLKSGTDDTWDIGTIAAGAGGTIGITGMATGQTNAAPLSFTGTLTAAPLGTGYVLDTETANAAVAVSPLLLSVTLNNTSAYVAGTDDSLDYVLSYANNDAVALQDVVIKAALTGSMYDFSTLRSDGSFDSVTDTVTWSQATNPELASLAPGQSGSVKIRITTEKAFPIKNANDKNFILAVRAQIQSPTIPPNIAASSTVETADIQNKVGGAIAITAAGYRKDASGIANTGPYPPVVNQPSQYTIHWNVTDYSTDVKNVVVSAYLKSGSVFTGRVKSNISTQPTYDAATGIVTWMIPSLPATTGVISIPAEAVFQVENTPAVNQVNQMVTLLGATSLSADDTFTNATLNASADPVTTQLPHDATVARQSGVVVQ